MAQQTQRIVVLIGLPGSGKSYWLRNKGSVLSSDDLRLLLADDAGDQTIHRIVFRTLRRLLRQRLELGRPVTYVDATNLTPRERRPYLKIGQMYGCAVDAVFFDVPVEVCLERNSGRARVVPVEAIQKMAEKLVPPAIGEGFSNITVVLR